MSAEIAILTDQFQKTVNESWQQCRDIGWMLSARGSVMTSRNEAARFIYPGTHTLRPLAATLHATRSHLLSAIQKSKQQQQ